MSINEGHSKYQGKSQLELPFPDPIYPQPQESTYREQPSTVYYYKETNSDTTNKPDHPKTMLPDMQTKAEVREQRPPSRLSSSRRSDVSSAELIDSVRIADKTSVITVPSYKHSCNANRKHISALHICAGHRVS